jgi:hypothetical protein
MTIPSSELDLNLDSTPIITWLAQARKAGQLDRTALRRSLIARMIWQASYQRSPGLIDNVAYLLGWKIWGDNPRCTLAGDVRWLRKTLAAAGHRLAYSNQPGQLGYYMRGRPSLDPRLVAGIHGALVEVDPVQMAIMRQHTPAERFGQAASMIEFVQRVAAARLRQRQPDLSEDESLCQIRHWQYR